MNLDVSAPSENFKSLVKVLFDRVKCKDPQDKMISIPIVDSAGVPCGFLKPIVKDFRKLQPELPELLSRWRNENPTISTGKFVAEAHRTADWLDKLVIGRDDRLLFMIVDPSDAPIGHVGFSNFDYDEQTAELDSVLKGEKKSPGIMTHASRALMAWGLQKLGLKDVWLSVFSDNESAIQFYARMGFVEQHRKPLYKAWIQGEEKLEIAPDGYAGPIEKHYIYMKYVRS